MQLAYYRRIVWGEAVGQTGVSPVDRHGVLSEIVGAHAEECADLRQPVGHHHGRGRFDHDSHRDGWSRTDTRLLQSPGLFHDDLARFFHLMHGGDQRQHQLDIVTGGGAKDGTYLGTKHLWLIETYPDGAPAQERIGFHRGLEGRGKLVAPQIEGPYDHG